MIEAAIAVEGFTKIFRPSLGSSPVVAVRDLTFQIQPGEIYGLLGPNGSGKSTTLKAVLGLLAPTRGTVKLFGQDSRIVSSRQEVGFLPESPYFHKFLTGPELLRFYGQLCGLGGEKLKARLIELLALVGLHEAGTRRLSTYSKGMLQRIGLAQALIHDPKVLVLDEPTAGVDPAGARMMRDLIVTLKQSGKTILLSSHLLGQVQEVCDRVGILAGGVLVREGTLPDLLASRDRMAIVLQGATPHLLQEIERLTAAAGATLVEQGPAHASLEEVFIKATRPDQA